MIRLCGPQTLSCHRLQTAGRGWTHQDAGLLWGQHVTFLAHLIVGQQGHHTCRERGSPSSYFWHRGLCRVFYLRPIPGRNLAGHLSPFQL